MADAEHPKITVEKREHLIKLISETIEKEGPNCDLNFINVSNQTDLTGVFLIRTEVSMAIFLNGMFRM